MILTEDWDVYENATPIQFQSKKAGFAFANLPEPITTYFTGWIANSAIKDMRGSSLNAHQNDGKYNCEDERQYHDFFHIEGV